MKKAITLFFTLIVYSMTVFAQPGTPNPSFGNNGFSLFQPGYGIFPHDSGDDIVAAADGTSYICGSAKVDASYQGILLNVLANGTLNNTFGTAGAVMLNFGDNSGTYAKNIDMQADGKLVVSGITYLSSNNAEFFVARFLPNGMPDLTFGSNGHFVTAISSNGEEYCIAQALQPDGKIVLAGHSNSVQPSTNSIVTRLNSNGTVDNTFGSGGFKMLNNWSDFDQINAISVLPTGEIVAVGTATNEMFEERAFIAKLSANGDMITTFGNNGVLVPESLNQNSGCNGLEVYNNFLYLTGWIGNEGEKNIYTYKTSFTGNPATNYGNGGITVTDVTVAPSGAEAGLDIKIQPNGKVVVCGTTGNPGISNRNLIVLRYSTDGILDNGFGTTAPGYTINSLGNLWDEFNGLDFLPNGKIVATGMSPQDGDNAIVAACYENNGFEPNASFVVDNDSVCAGSMVHFTSTSTGNYLQYNWSFPGGTPSSSTLQNPTVQYNSNGIFNVQLSVTNSVGTDIEIVNNMITVFNQVPSSPSVPTGPVTICSGQTASYTIPPVPTAISYLWSVSPSAAGTLSSNGLSALFTSSAVYAGSYSISVIAVGLCGNSQSSPVLTGVVSVAPQIFLFEGNGSYCSGTGGAVLTLSDSQIGITYDLLLDGASTGTVIQGTGSALTWSNITQQGFYSVLANTGSCTQPMAGQIYVTMITAPTQPLVPAGPGAVCNSEISTYTTDAVANATSYVWNILPGDAATINSDTIQADLDWNDSFSGIAVLSVAASNACGTSTQSEVLSVTVNAAPVPVISGPIFICKDMLADYQTNFNAGSTYEWIVTGGEIISGNGTAQVKVKWNTVGTGTLNVTEISAFNCSGTAPIYSVAVDPCVGMNANFENNGLVVYPNPAINSLFVEFPEKVDGDIELQIVNPSGKTLLIQNYTTMRNKTEKVNISQLMNGFYILKFYVDGELISKTKFIKIN